MEKYQFSGKEVPISSRRGQTEWPSLPASQPTHFHWLVFSPAAVMPTSPAEEEVRRPLVSGDREIHKSAAERVGERQQGRGVDHQRHIQVTEAAWGHLQDTGSKWKAAGILGRGILHVGQPQELAWSLIL